MVEIRSERPDDSAAIRDVVGQAFAQYENPRVVSSTTGLVEMVRTSDSFVPELSLVALEHGRIVGHVMFSVIKIRTTQGELSALSLAPVSVLPEYGNRGIGSQLIKQGISVAKRLGYSIVIVVGYPGFYPRFGFVRASTRGLKASFELPDEAFMVMELIPSLLDNVEGTVVFPPEFEI